MLAAMLGLKSPIAIGDRVKPCIRVVDNERAFLTYVPANE
jgi:hypothetical protein